MKIQAKLTAEDYVQAQFLHLRPRPVFKWLGALLVLLALLAVGASTWACMQGRGPWHRPVILVATLSYLFIWFRLWLPRKTRKIFAQQKLLHEPMEIEITPAGFSTTATYGTSHLEWRALHKYKAGKELMLVYQSDVIFHMFPRRWFASDADWNQLRAYLQQSLKPS